MATDIYHRTGIIMIPDSAKIIHHFTCRAATIREAMAAKMKILTVG